MGDPPNGDRPNGDRPNGDRPNGEQLAVGELVAWIGAGSMTTGRIVRVLTAPERVGPPGRIGTRVRASEDDPWFLVESELGGIEAAYRRQALTRL